AGLRSRSWPRPVMPVSTGLTATAGSFRGPRWPGHTASFPAAMTPVAPGTGVERLCDAAVVAERASDFYGGTMDSNKFDDAGAPAARPALRRAVEEASGLPWAEARTRWDVSNVDHD